MLKVNKIYVKNSKLKLNIKN